MAVDGSNVKEMIESIKNAGIGVIGTPEQAVEHMTQKYAGELAAKENATSST